MNADSWPLWFQLTFQALVLQALPGFSRPGILFAVTVPDAFVSNAGRALLSRYRAVVWTGTAIALAIVLLVPTSGSGNEGILYLAVIGGNAIVGVGAWLWAHRRARAYAIPHSEKRVASLVPRDTSLPGGTLFALGPLLLLLISALLVVTHPDQDTTSMTAALRPLAFGALSVAMMLTMAVSLSRSTRQIAVEGMAAAAEQRFRRLNVFVLLLAGYGTAMMLSAVALESMPALGVHLAGSLGFLMVPLMAINFGIAFWMFRVGQGGQRAIAGTEPQDARGDRTPDDAWRVGGLFYYNPNDPAVWVEKRVGLGYTLNMGNSRAWLLVAMLLLPMLAGPLLFR